MVKEFELDPLADVWIFLDAARGVHATKPPPPDEYDPQDIWKVRSKFNLPQSTEEYAVSAAASLARFYLQRGRAVGLAFSGQSLNVIPSDRGGRQLGKILEALALLRAEGTLPLQGLIEAQARYLPRGSTVVLVTPATTETIVRITDLLLRRGLRPVVVLIDSATFGGYFSSVHIEKSLSILGVPVCNLRYGDDMSEVLSSATSAPTWG
jgi:uncharacterized protein (DUF58 family)